MASVSILVSAGWIQLHSIQCVSNPEGTTVSKAASFVCLVVVDPGQIALAPEHLEWRHALDAEADAGVGGVLILRVDAKGISCVTMVCPAA